MKSLRLFLGCCLVAACASHVLAVNYDEANVPK